MGVLRIKNMKNRPLECRFEATYAFIHYGPMTRSASFDGFVDGSRDSVSFLLTIQATGFLTVALVGLFSPLNTPAFAGHTSMPVYPGAPDST